jgi:hypothetical protein
MAHQDRGSHLPDAIAFGATAVKNGVASHAMMIDPAIVARCVGVDPALTAHASLVRSRGWNSQPINSNLIIASLRGRRELGIALLRMDRRPMRCVGLRGNGGAQQQHGRNKEKAFHDLSSLYSRYFRVHV